MRTGIVAATIIAGLVMPTSMAFAVDGFERLLARQIAVNEAAQSAQARVDRLDDERKDLLARYRQGLAQIDSAKRYVEQVETLIADQEAEIVSYQERIERVGDTQRRIIPLMLEMIDHLEEFIAADLPFLLEERRDRLATIREAMDRADVPTAEKVRLVLQAYRIEADYGRGIEAYRAALPGDEARQVDFLRIGRVALIYRSLDGRQAAAWDKASSDWLPLKSGYRRDLEQAFRIAREQAAPNLVVLPSPTPVRAQQAGAAP